MVTCPSSSKLTEHPGVSILKTRLKPGFSIGELLFKLAGLFRRCKIHAPYNLTSLVVRDSGLFMSDELFPSGPWVGFYNYGPACGRHRMELGLTFVRGRLAGDGIDDIGRFLIAGRFDATARECHWTKTYPGSHDVFYRGFREGKGIWGTWEIGTLSHGGFHIWPKTAGDLEGERSTSAEAEPVEAIGKELVSQPRQAPGRDVCAQPGEAGGDSQC